MSVAAAGEDGLAAADAEDERAALLTVLDTLHDAWTEMARTGDPAAAAIVLTICKQRAALLGLGRGASPAVRVAATAGGAGGADEQAGREVKVVVEYVNDWREVLRRRG